MAHQPSSMRVLSVSSHLPKKKVSMNLCGPVSSLANATRVLDSEDGPDACQRPHSPSCPRSSTRVSFNLGIWASLGAMRRFSPDWTVV